VAVAAYVSTQAWIKLYEYLSKLGQSVLYYDTESVIFIQKDNEPQKWKSYLRDLTHELEKYDLFTLPNNLYRMAQRTMRFRYFATQPENVQ